MNVVYMYVYIYYYLNDCELRKNRQERTIF
jgi:hypothetical protein